jgi:hypothetical protein
MRTGATTPCDAGTAVVDRFGRSVGKVDGAVALNTILLEGLLPPGPGPI